MSISRRIKPLLPHRELRLLLVLSVCLSSVCCGRTQASDTKTLLTIAREYRQNNQPSRALRANQSVDQPTSSKEAHRDEAQYQDQITKFLSEWNFDQLENAAREARTGKGRLEGGVWKLDKFYDAVSKPVAGDHATETDWATHFETLKQWVSAKPESATPRVAIAETYVSYSWVARGEGYAGTVTDNGWKLFKERTQLAKLALLDAARLKDKCPHWYEVMLEVALAEGWDKAQEKELFEQATAFEPLYYLYYREYANFLLPKWYGNQGEAEALAEEVSNRVGGREGDLLYFEIASVVICQCSSQKPPMPDMSWPRIKQGYLAIGQLYGLSRRKMNRFALMAYVADDKLAAQEAFAKIGNDWDPKVWTSSGSFEKAKAWQ